MNKHIVYVPREQMEPEGNRPKTIYTGDFGIFPGHYVFVLGISFEETIAILEAQDCDEWIASAEKDGGEAWDHPWITFYNTVKNEKGEEIKCHWIMLHEFRGSNGDYSKLAHECIHLVYHRLHHPGTLDIRVEEECFAYLHTYIMETILSKIKETIDG